MSTIDFAVCVYCGCAKADTADHVPPKLLFPVPRPSDLITVPCCRACNSSFQRDDQYLRAALLLRRDIADEPEAQAIMEAFFRSLERPQSYGFGKSFFDTMHMAEFRTTGGIYTGRIPARRGAGPRGARVSGLHRGEKDGRPAGQTPSPCFGAAPMLVFLLLFLLARTAADPDATLLAFLQSTYEAGATLAGWDRATLETRRRARPDR